MLNLREYVAYRTDFLFTLGPNFQEKKAPDQSDFFIGLAVVQGFESYRMGDRGSWFIQELCNNIKEYAFADQKHFPDIFTKANRVSLRGKYQGFMIRDLLS